MRAIDGAGNVIALGELPSSLRALFTSFLVTIGFGYVAALGYLFLTDVDPHRKMGMSIAEGITMKYYGTGDSTRLEAALRGAMADKLPAVERDQLLRWIAGGAKEAEYGQVSPIIQRNCLTCHADASPVAALASYDQLRKFTAQRHGPGFATLARVSHVHLFGISIIFLLTGGIFALSAVAPTMRLTIIVIPFLAIWADIGSWWLTRYVPVFAYVVLAGGALMGLALATQILISLWEMWFRSSTREGQASAGR